MTIKLKVIVLISLVSLALGATCFAGQVEVIDPTTGKIHTFTRMNAGDRNHEIYVDNETGETEIVNRDGGTIIDRQGNIDTFNSSDPDFYMYDSANEPGHRLNWPGLRRELK